MDISPTKLRASQTVYFEGAALMGRGAGKAQWQSIELLAAFKAGEAACDRAQVGSTTVRSSKAAVEYANHLRLLVKDDKM